MRQNPAGPYLSRAADPVTSDIFTGNTGGYAIYRIPGLVVTSKGTLLAYCEARKTPVERDTLYREVRRDPVTDQVLGDALVTA